MKKRLSKIKPDRWYVVDLTKFTTPRLMRTPFNDEGSARKAMEETFADYTHYSVIIGEKAIKYNIGMYSPEERPITTLKVTKYFYPPDRNTRKKRKTLRTLIRRYNRQNGINPENQ